MKPYRKAISLLFVATSLLLAGCLEAAAQDSAGNGAQDPNTLAGCPEFKPSYLSCEKLSGSMPPFFESVSIATHAQGFAFTTVQVDGGELHTEYVPDGVFRLGSDYHTLPTGEVLADLPSLETSFCRDGRLVRREFTVLPDQTLAQEQLQLWVGDQDQLNFTIVVNGDQVLEVRCYE